MSDFTVISIDNDADVVAIDQTTLADVSVIGPTPPSSPGAHRLDELDDVAGADDGSPGQALVKGGNGIWIPQVVGGGGGGVSYHHVQDSPSTVWLVGHGLGFQPAGIDVYDISGNVYYPDIEYVDLYTVRLTFGDSVRGDAYLS
jgi:hypothetical protein